MNLQTAFHSAKSALLATAAQTSVVSRNVAGAGETGYVRRSLSIEPLGDGEVRAGAVERAADKALRSAALAAGSDASAAAATVSALSDLRQTIGDTDSTVSPTTNIGLLRSALTAAAAAPQDASALAAAVDAAGALAASLRSASTATQAARSTADGKIAESVARINEALQEFGAVNTAIVIGRRTGADVSDAQDRRDALLTRLSAEIGVSVVESDDGDTSIYTDSGATLFQGSARAVTFDKTASFAANVTGAAVYVDGVAVTGASASMKARSGAIAALADVRDRTAVTYQAQLDEVARGLIVAFAGHSQSGAPDRTGMFAWSGGPALPSGLTAGLASQISVDAAVDPTRGGDATLLRDGGVGGADFVANATGGIGFTDLLRAYGAGLDTPMAAAPEADLATSASVASLADLSAGWLEGKYKTASDASSRADALSTHAQTALDNSLGVNIDDQMSALLDLEHSYQASAKMIAAVDQMYSSLFSSIGAG